MPGQHGSPVAASTSAGIAIAICGRAEDYVVPLCRSSYKGGLFEGTPAGELLRRSGMDAALAPNVLLSFLWASLDNIVPAAFWTLAFLLLPEQA